MRFTFNRRQLALAVALVSAAACRSSTEVPEPGALLLKVKLAPGARTPDEIRLFVYDDTGALWNDVRVPAEGPLVAQSATDLGTIVIQPGVTVGDLRFDLHGLSAGTMVAEGTLTIAAAAATGGTFDVTLAAALPADGDGDGVPDPIDDCPAVPDPKQSGCQTDGGVTDAAGVRRDAAVDEHPDAGRDVPPKAQGTTCGAARECASGFCKDGVCCNNACTGACNSCSTGKCTEVKNATDAPECIAPMTCDKKGRCVSASGGGGN